MDKETKSCRSRIFRSHDGKIREARSVDRHHHYSAKHSFRKPCNSSIPSHVKKCKRRTGKDHLEE
jgi:hypothetical protein